MQATGYDARGRKQYRYHADYRAHRDAEKFAGLADFGRALPKLRACVERDLAKRRLDKNKAVAAVIRLLDGGQVRVGNDCYAQENDSYGATTLRSRHVRLNGQTIALRFRGKSGKVHSLKVTDRLLANAVRRCQDLPGQRLFTYIGGDGEIHPVTSGDVNAYIHEVMDTDYSAKHFPYMGCQRDSAGSGPGERRSDSGESGARARERGPRQYGRSGQKRLCASPAPGPRK